MDNTELKPLPCPFCGGEPKVDKFMNSYHIICSECDSASGMRMTEEKAVEAWNTRKYIQQIEEKMPVWSKKMDELSDRDYSKDPIHAAYGTGAARGMFDILDAIWKILNG